MFLLNGAGLAALCPALCQYPQSPGITVAFKNKYLLCLPVHRSSSAQKFVMVLKSTSYPCKGRSKGRYIFFYYYFIYTYICIYYKSDTC